MARTTRKRSRSLRSTDDDSASSASESDSNSDSHRPSAVNPPKKRSKRSRTPEMEDFFGAGKPGRRLLEKKPKASTAAAAEEAMEGYRKVVVSGSSSKSRKAVARANEKGKGKGKSDAPPPARWQHIAKIYLLRRGLKLDNEGKMEPLRIDTDELDVLERYGMAVSQGQNKERLRFDRNSSESDMVLFFREKFPAAYDWLRTQVQAGQNEFEPLRKKYQKWHLPPSATIQNGEWFFSQLPLGHQAKGWIVLIPAVDIPENLWEQWDTLRSSTSLRRHRLAPNDDERAPPGSSTGKSVRSASGTSATTAAVSESDIIDDGGAPATALLRDDVDTPPSEVSAPVLRRSKRTSTRKNVITISSSDDDDIVAFTGVPSPPATGSSSTKLTSKASSSRPSSSRMVPAQMDRSDDFEIPHFEAFSQGESKLHDAFHDPYA